MTDDREPFREAREAGLRARQERRLENATYTAAEVKVLTEDACKVAAEAGRRIGRKEAAEDIARTADEIGEGCSAAAKTHRKASIEATTAPKKRSHMQTALAFINQAAGAWAVAEFARDYPHEALADAASGRTEAPGYSDLPQDSQAGREALSEQDVVHEDLRQILLALGLGDQARPYSSHEVVQREVLPAIRRLAPIAKADPS